MHVLHCEILLRIESGARFNPRYASCFVEEDWVGHVTAMAKASVHASTVSKRCLERWMLQYNSWIAGEGKNKLEWESFRHRDPDSNTFMGEFSAFLKSSRFIPASRPPTIRNIRQVCKLGSGSRKHAHVHTPTIYIYIYTNTLCM